MAGLRESIYQRGLSVKRQLDPTGKLARGDTLSREEFREGVASMRVSSLPAPPPSRSVSRARRDARRAARSGRGRGAERGGARQAGLSTAQVNGLLKRVDPDHKGEIAVEALADLLQVQETEGIYNPFLHERAWHGGRALRHVAPAARARREYSAEERAAAMELKRRITKRVYERFPKGGSAGAPPLPSFQPPNHRQAGAQRGRRLTRGAHAQCSGGWTGGGRAPSARMSLCGAWRSCTSRPRERRSTA
jgi:hypothetical protein